MMAALKVALHAPVLSRWGYQHDELYFIACGRHPAFGYVDHPPMVPWLARAIDELFGASLFALRLPGVLAGAAALFLTGLLVARLGGGKVAQWIACLSMLVAPVFLRSPTMLTIPAFEPLIWVAVAYLLVRLAHDESLRLWCLVGVVVGVGVLTKHSTLFMVPGLLIGVLSGGMRSHLRTPWPYLGALLALVIISPHLFWQVQHGWPTIEFLHNLNAMIRPHVSPPLFTLGQLLYLNPVTAPVWIAGLLWLFGPSGAKGRVLGWTFILAFLFLAFAGSKLYYLAPAYPAVMAAGGVALERRGNAAAAVSDRGAFSLLPTLTPLLIGGLIVLPICLPIMPIDGTERYVRGLTFGVLEKAYEVTGDLRGQAGWKERVGLVAQVYWSLPEGTRDKAVILSGFYGSAAAIDFFGSSLKLPPAFSPHMTYFLWGPPKETIGPVIAVDFAPEKLQGLFADVTVAGEVQLPAANPKDRVFRVYLCEHPKVSMATAWGGLRRYGFE